VPRFGLKVESSAFALAREGSQMFGVMTCTNGHGRGDFALAIGLRNSYDRSLSIGLVAGTRVFCCDNLAFSGAVRMNRKHTAHVFRDLPDLIYRMLSQVSSMQDRIRQEVSAMKGYALVPTSAHHLIVQAIRANVLPASRLPKVLEAWEHPKHEEFRSRSAWSLFNALTEVLKEGSAWLQMEGSLRLSQLFRTELPLN
jgi:hypothetical protein